MNPKRATLVAAILGSGIVFLDSTVVNVALQRIGEGLPSAYFGALEGESYVYTGYLLSLSALLILAGALADAYGRRRMFAIGLVGFGAGSALCGFAPTMEALVLFRIVQGAAGALLVPGSLALLNSTFEGEERGRAFGLWAGASAATSVLGPPVGGLLVETLSWRAVFFINVPLILVALWATLRFVEESRDDSARVRGFDWAGAALAAIAVGGLSFGAIYGQERQWADPVGPAAIVIGAVAGVVFVVHMARGRHPLVPLGLFRSRNFAVTNLTTFLIYGALYVTSYQSAIFTQGTLGYSAIAAGLISVPAGVLLALLSARVGALGARFGPRRFMALGPAIMALGLLWLVRVPASSEPWQLQPGKTSTYLPTTGFVVDFLPFGLLFGIGLAIMVAPLTTALMTSVPGRQAGLGSAINNAISRVGPQLAGAVIFIALTGAFYADLSTRAHVDTSSAAFRRAVSPLNAPPPTASPALAAATREASTDSFHLAMAITAGLLLAGAAINAVGIRDPERGRRGSEGSSSSEAQPGVARGTSEDEDEPVAAASTADATVANSGATGEGSATAGA